MGAALSASRMGCRVALIQNRSVLGGNGSSEIRVWAMGEIRRGKYPRIGEIIEEFSDHATKSPGTYEEFEDQKKIDLVLAEKNIDLFLNHHAYDIDMKDDTIVAVYAFDTRTSERRRFSGKLFSDCTGHGTIGALAGADWEMQPEDRMGMSNMWRWEEGEEERSFPETPWALDLAMRDFPYPNKHHGQWFWESGYNKDPLNDAEGIRDWNLRAVYGAFNAMKNGDGAEQHKTAYLTWIAYIGGVRESRRLMGDVILTEDDIISKRQFPDGVVPSTWSIDLHYPKKQYARKFPDNPFIAIAEQVELLDRAYGYPIPYRSLYSRNINNLFMAGRDISVTHEALGTTRVMKTCGMMGEVVGRAASICILKQCTPREVYEKHWLELDALLQLPGKARRATLDDQIVIPDDALPLAEPADLNTGYAPDELPGQVIDDITATKTGSWTSGTGLKGYVAQGYLYASPDSNATARFDFVAPETGRYSVRVAYLEHENRGSAVPITVSIDNKTSDFRIDMRKLAPGEFGFYPLTELDLQRGEKGSVSIGTLGAGGFVHVDAVALVRLD